MLIRIVRKGFEEWQVEDLKRALRPKHFIHEVDEIKTKAEINIVSPQIALHYTGKLSNNVIVVDVVSELTFCAEEQTLTSDELREHIEANF